MNILERYTKCKNFIKKLNLTNTNSIYCISIYQTNYFKILVTKHLIFLLQNAFAVAIDDGVVKSSHVAEIEPSKPNNH